MENLKRFAKVNGGLAPLQINDEAEAHVGYSRQFILPEALRFPGGADDGAEMGGGEIAHDYSRTVNNKIYLNQCFNNFTVR
jgi:hypothetical protein